MLLLPKTGKFCVVHTAICQCCQELFQHNSSYILIQVLTYTVQKEPGLQLDTVVLTITTCSSFVSTHIYIFGISKTVLQRLRTG